MSPSETSRASTDDRIPTLAEHEAELRRLWRTSILGASILFAGAVGGILALSATKDVSALVAISTIGFQIIAVSYVAGFFAPAFVTSLRKLSLGIRLNYRGLELARETMGSLERIKKDLDPLIERAHALMGRVEALADGEEGPLSRIADDIARMRARIERETAPLNIQRR